MFLIFLCCRLLKQPQTALNLMRPETSNPKLAAQMELEGSFDFNNTPLVPPGTKVIVHKKLGQINNGNYMEYKDGIWDWIWSTTDC